MQTPQTEVLIRAADGAELLRSVLGPGDYLLGRAPECELSFEAEQVSRRRVQLTINFDHALIEDLGSSNGTRVNGKPVTEVMRLWPGQKIQVGSATVELRRQKTLSLPDVSLAPSVAMKVMLDGSSPDALVRFIAEARATGQLEHPNIVPVHELGVDENDQVFYTMKFVQGVTLKKVLEGLAAECGSGVPPESLGITGGTPVPLSATYPLGALLTVFQKVCDAVAFAHSKGVIHRDLKPDNIMLGDYGEVLVMDWGLAKILGATRSVASHEQEPNGAGPFRDSDFLQPIPEAEGATMGRTILGTPQYMAPEQARGEVETLDARADIYALRPSVTGDDAHAIVDKVARGEILGCGDLSPLCGERKLASVVGAESPPPRTRSRAPSCAKASSTPAPSRAWRGRLAIGC